MQPIPMMFITIPALACRGAKVGRGYSEFMGRFEYPPAPPQTRPNRTHHVGHFEVTIGEDDGVGGRGYRQHEGKGGAEGAGDHHVQRVQAYRLGLSQDTENSLQ